VNRQIGVEESKYRVTDDTLFTGRERVTWPTFKILGPPPYVGNGRSQKRQIWHAGSLPGVLMKEMQI